MLPAGGTLPSRSLPWRTRQDNLGDNRSSHTSFLGARARQPRVTCDTQLSWADRKRWGSSVMVSGHVPTSPARLDRIGSPD